MLQILSWLCLISICGLSSQIFIYMCENAIVLFNSLKYSKKTSSSNQAISSITVEFENKIAK